MTWCDAANLAKSIAMIFAFITFLAFAILATSKISVAIQVVPHRRKSQQNETNRSERNVWPTFGGPLWHADRFTDKMIHGERELYRNISQDTFWTFQHLSCIKCKEMFKAWHWHPSKQHAKLQGKQMELQLFSSPSVGAHCHDFRAALVVKLVDETVMQFGTSHPVLSKGQIYDFTTAVPVSSSSEGSASPAHQCLETLILAT